MCVVLFANGISFLQSSHEHCCDNIFGILSLKQELLITILLLPYCYFENLIAKFDAGAGL